MKLHHIGKVVHNLKEAQDYYKETFGLLPLGEPTIDPIQKVEVVYLNAGYGDEITLELICPVGEDSPVYKFLQKGGGFHHLSFLVEDIQQEIERLKGKGAIILGDVVPGIGRKKQSTVWLYTRSRELVELVEKE
jgi:methylmalonyl-CoA/ethylmalonyl-CoA epimerase